MRENLCISNMFLSSYCLNAYIKLFYTYFKCNKILKLSDQYKLQVSNYIFQVFHSNIDEEIESSLLVNNQINIATIQGPTTK